MTFTLYIDEPRWREHLAAVVVTVCTTRWFARSGSAAWITGRNGSMTSTSPPNAASAVGTSS